MDGKQSILPLALRDVSFVAGGKRLIKDMTCQFNAGPRSIIMGPNGAGKSLLLRLCHGLIQPAAGEVVWSSRDDTARRQAMVFQRPVMLRRSVEANVDYALKLRKTPKEERRELIADALGKTGILRLAHQPARVLSIGEQQRLALARVWALKPEVLFLDEPTASLDPAATHAVEGIVNAIHQAGTRIIMTTHDLSQSRRMADEVLFLYRGRLLEKSPAKKFFANPENDLARAFISNDLLWWKLGKNGEKKRKPLHET